MKSIFPSKIIDFYKKETELNIIFFKLLGTAGIIISFAGAISSFFTGSDPVNIFINIGAAIASVALIVFVDRTGHYLIGYLITSFAIFMGLFGMLFFESGGLYGSMPYFFSFGILFTLLMYKGKLLVFMEILHVSFYVAIAHIAHMHPETVKTFATPAGQFFDQVSGIVISSVGIGIIFMMYLKEYQKQQKIAQESSNAKSILLANISHEIRTPINMLLGMNEMIYREAENRQIIEYSQNVDTAGRQLLFMINQFLDLSRIDMGKEEIFEENFNITNLIESLRSYYKKEADNKHLDFVTDADKELPGFVIGDVRKLTQILMNLLSNAIKYTNEGIIVFGIQKLAEDAESVTIHFEVSDTGVGISKEDQQKIFESFERSAIVRQRGIEGTGLGLAISGNLAKLLGTEIKVKSKFGEGSLFWFDLKLKRGVDMGYDKATGETFIAPDARILAVDDNSMNLTVLKSLLRRTLVRVDTAQSALESYEMYEKGNYDLVLMDYMMPDIDGIAAMEELRRIDKRKGKNTPIIVLTADATPERKKLFNEKGFDDYLLKPIDVMLLETVLIRHLPKELVTIVEKTDQIDIPEETLGQFKKILEKYDISFDMAMKHLSGDIMQFVRIAEVFVERAEGSICELKELIRSKEYAKAAYIIHSVKGNSGNVGAQDLYYNARRLEKRAKDGDGKYVDAASELFFMEWERAKEGLTKFLEEFAKVGVSFKPAKAEEVLDENALMEKLLEAVRNGNQSPALNTIDEIEAIRGKMPEISAIREAVKDIDFDRAEKLIEELKR